MRKALNEYQGQVELLLEIMSYELRKYQGQRKLLRPEKQPVSEQRSQLRAKEKQKGNNEKD